jgi:pyruvate,water dikinase
MGKGRRAIVWFNEVTKDDVPLVGGKGANLGEMTRAEIPVPPGFIVTADAYFDFIEEAKLDKGIRDLLQPLDSSNSKQLQHIADQVKQLILEATMPDKLASEIRESYVKLGRGLVAVRSSATAEDLPTASFAGQQRTFLNVENEDEVVLAVQECWASLFEPRAIFYREQQGFDHFKVGIAVPVQKMVQSQSSGVMFTLEPVSSDRSKIVIEAIYGLGEAIVGGEVNPDLYIIDKDGLGISTKKIGEQEWQLIKNPDGRGDEVNIKVALSSLSQKQQKISDDDIIHLAKLAKQLEDHYEFPQDIEWAKEGEQIFIVQTRPVTTVKETVEEMPEVEAPMLLTGASASPGMASGPVKIVYQASEIDKVAIGDVLVTEMTTPDFVPAMKRAVAIVTNRGGRTSHAAIVSRELGIPCVVGAEKATTRLIDGQIITVDGSRGSVYEGKIAKEKTALLVDMLKEEMKTRTKVYVNLAQPELVERIASRKVDGVGLLRAEFIIGEIGQHPQYMISQNRGEEFTGKLYEGINAFAKAFDPRPVVYRATDFKTNEYRELKGGQQYEEVEENPMLGYRGATRYIREPEVFALEMDAVKRVRQNYRNLWVMLPFVRTVEELAEVKNVMESQGLVRSTDFKLWMMVEIPSNIILMEDFLKVGIDGISIGSNDLTQLILGIDRDSPKLAKEFDERSPAVLVALERAIKVSKRMGVTSSICGQAPSVYPELTEKLVEWGITSVSVSPDMIGVSREIIARAEEKLGIDDKPA